MTSGELEFKHQLPPYEDLWRPHSSGFIRSASLQLRGCQGRAEKDQSAKRLQEENREALWGGECLWPENKPS